MSEPSPMRNLFAQSSLIPISKIANAPTKSIRLLWIVFSTTMVLGLLGCVGLVVKQYLQQQTIFQLDFSGKNNAQLDNFPSISICFFGADMTKMFQNAMTKWIKSKGRKGYKYKAPNPNSKSLPWFGDGDTISDFYNDTIGDDVSMRQYSIVNILKWSTKTAKSPMYRYLHNFSVSFSILPDQENNRKLTMNVQEQVPHTRQFMCTTFEFVPSDSNYFWLSITATVDNEKDTYSEGQYLSGYKLIFITHQRGTLPFSAYDKHITETIPSGIKRNIFMSKSVTRRLDTNRNPCKVDGSTVRLFGHDFEFSHDVCGWKYCCNLTEKECKCTCAVDVMHNIKNSCMLSGKLRTCMNNVCSQEMSRKVCPTACTVSKYNKHNLFDETIPQLQNVLALVKSENVQVATEEKLYTLTKLCSEIGGLCSLFIGLSFIFVFEIFEAIIIWRQQLKDNRKNRTINCEQGENIEQKSECEEKVELTMDKSVACLDKQMANNYNNKTNNSIYNSANNNNYQNRSTLGHLVNTLDVSNSPQMGHFLTTSSNANNYIFSDDGNLIPQNIQTTMIVKTTIVLILPTDNSTETEQYFYFYGNTDIDKEQLIKYLRLGTAKFKLI